VAVTPDAATIFIAGSTTLTATVRDAAGNSLSGRTISWTSANLNVATVTNAGVVTGLAPGGPVAITATSEGQSSSAQITVIAPVASVTVAPNAASLVVGQTTTLVATPRDAGNNPLTGRTITWSTSDPSRATVSQGGVVTAVVAGGPVTITATSEGQSGNAQVTVLVPVSSVVVTGNFRTKVGDVYTYTATARLADGTIVNRPMTWSVEDPASGTMTASGTLTPLRTGNILILVTIDDDIWEADATAYDWFPFGSGTTFGVALVADLQIANKFGTSEYPQLAMGCSGGSFVLFVDTENFVTQSGGVAYSFDGATPESAVWVEFDSFSALAHPGSNASTRNFANRMGGAARFGFAFTEFLGPARATIFRVTGLAARLGSFVTGPVASPPVTAVSSVDPLAALLARTGRSTKPSAERDLRAALREATPGYPDLRIGNIVSPETQRAVRSKRER
jgi:uncharacterized protein YjdB